MASSATIASSTQEKLERARAAASHLAQLTTAQKNQMEAEARLAAALMAGQRLSAVAADRGVQITTVRTQLEAILKKVGVKRQSDLFRILSSTGIGSVSLAAAWFDVAPDVLQLPLPLVSA